MAATREEAREALERGQAEADRLVRALTDEDVSRPGALGDWSVQDLIGHLACWEDRALQAFESARTGSPFPALVGIRAVDELNAANIAAWRRKDLARVRADAKATHRRLVGSIEACTDREWRAVVTLSTAIHRQLRTLVGSTTGGSGGPFAHTSDHLPDLRAYVDSVGAGSVT